MPHSGGSVTACAAQEYHRKRRRPPDTITAMPTGLRAQAVSLVALVLVGLLLAVPVTRAADHDIAIRDTGFDPPAVTVFVGEPVTWTNAGTTDHTVTNADAGLDSGPIGPNEAYGHVFDSPGSFSYADTIGGLSGTITVKVPPPTAVPAGSPSPTPPSGTLPPNFSPNPAPSLDPGASALASSPSPAAVPVNANSAAPTWLIAVVVAALIAALGWLLLRARSRSARRPGR